MTYQPDGRCPECGLKEVWKRQWKEPPYRCGAGHEFEDLVGCGDDPRIVTVYRTTDGLMFDWEIVEACWRLYRRDEVSRDGYVDPGTIATWLGRSESAVRSRCLRL